MSAAQIKHFLSSSAFAVVGASAAREKFGNKVLQWYISRNRSVVPVHPKEKTIEGIACVSSLAELHQGKPIDGEQSLSVSVVTPPAVTKGVLDAVVKMDNVRAVWLQPGAEFDGCNEFAKKHGIKLIYGGPCILRDTAKL